MVPFSLTTPIYYVNAKPHLGHAYTTILCDSLVRFQKMMGRESFFVTGTDEHGDKIAQVAEKAGCSPQEFSDTVSAEFRDLWPRLGLKPDRFIRTTEAVHKKAVQEFLQRVYDAGDIYFGEYGGHYCLGCERFYTEKELTESGVCPQHLTKPEYISEKNYFFRMAKYQDWLKGHIADNPDFIRPERYKNEVLSLLNSGALDDLCISRPKSRLTWGIELPFDTDYVCYVWFDALISYISALGWPDNPHFDKFWAGEEHMVAKDILKPHAVFWPTMLKAVGLEPYKHLNVHGYWLVKDTKMSKSLGNVVVPLDLAQKYGVDAFRYFLLREIHFGSDGNFSEDALVARLNADLANDLGNLFSRVLSMSAKFRGSKVPACGQLIESDRDIQELASNAFRNFQLMFDQVRTSTALESLWELVRGLNKYVDSSAPWALAKAGDTERLDTVLYILLEYMRKIALHLLPVIPTTARCMLEQLGCPADENALLPGEIDSFGSLPAGTALAPSSNLFPRIELEKATASSQPQESAKANVKKEKAAPTIPPLAPLPEGCIDYADFQKPDLRIGTVVAAEQHPNADKLLRLEIDLGEAEPRQIVSGIAEHFSPSALVGKQVAVVANLAPRMLRGLESRGMLLTAPSEKGLELVTVAGPVPNGSKLS